MERDNLVEIKKGKTGTGYLIENDGYVAMDNYKAINEAYNGQNNDGKYCPYPFIVSAVFQKYGIKNANGRIYPEDVLKREVQRYMKKIQDKNAIGECNHPAESVIDLSRTSINIIELHWEGHTLVGKMEILVTPGFVNSGIVSTCADEIANLLMHGIKIGVSSRALGTVEQMGGTLYVKDDLELICWDVVSDPSTPNAWISTTGEEGLQQYVESTDKNNSKKELISEKIDKINDILNIL